MNRFDLLAQIQDVDIRIEENNRSRREAEARLSDSTTLDASQQAVADAEHRAHEIQTRLRSLELEANGIGDKIKAVESRLYDGRTSNPKELSGLEQDAEMLKRRKNEVEDQELEAMAQLEAAEAARARNREILEKVSAEMTTVASRARLTLEELRAADAKLTSTRQHLCSQIPAADLTIYENLRREKKGRALAHIKGPACEACGFSVPSGLASRVRMGQEMEFCSNCGRILIA
jgi:uncharacterized protein